MVNLESTVRIFPCFKCVAWSATDLFLRCYRIDGLVKLTCSRTMRMFSSETNRHFDVEGQIPRRIPKDKEEEMILKKLKGPTPLDPKILSATIVGMPNAGKSTLTNALLGWRVASVSKKVHTTLHNTKAVIVEGNSQIVLLDTPGIVSKYETRRHNLKLAMLTEPKASISDADLIIALVDVSNVWHRRRLDGKLLELLKTHAAKPSVLVLNKVDLLASKRVLLDATRRLTDGFIGHIPIPSARSVAKPKSHTNELENILARAETDAREDRSELVQDDVVSSRSSEEDNSCRKDGWPHFERVFMISALEKDGVQDLKDYLMSQTRSGEWRCSSHLVTDEKPQDIIILAVREKLLDCLPQELPYNLNLQIESMDVDQHRTMRVVVSITVPMERHMKLVIGGGGCTIQKIADGARQELMNTFRCDILLRLIVQCSQKRNTKSNKADTVKHRKKSTTEKLLALKSKK